MSAWSRNLRKSLPRSDCFWILFFFTLFLVGHGVYQVRTSAADLNGTVDEYLSPIPATADLGDEAKKADPVQWLRENIHDDPAYVPSVEHLRSLQSTRPKAAFVALVRNSELNGMIDSMFQLESRFNSKLTHRYDWIFFNNEEFTHEFKGAVTNATGSRCFFETIPDEHWMFPDWVDESRSDIDQEFTANSVSGKAWLQSYHHMHRWNAGLFALEKRLLNYDWFWRVEPNVKFSCDINYDVFRFMRDNDIAYGFNMAILYDARSFPSLWERTKAFKRDNDDMVHPEADMRWLLHPTNEPDKIIRTPAGYEATTVGEEYNKCQFYSNFEIGSLNYFRSEEHRSYFDHLDKAGGFFYEHYGDAPVHTLSVSMFLPKRRVWFFRDVGYAQSLCSNCAPHKHDLPMGPEPDPKKIKASELSTGLTRVHNHRIKVAQDMKRRDTIPGLRCGCTAQNFDNNFSDVVPCESKQRKPKETRIRMWLGGEDTEKHPGWSREGEMALDGEGYGEDRISGLETSLEQDINYLRNNDVHLLS